MRLIFLSLMLIYLIPLKADGFKYRLSDTVIIDNIEYDYQLIDSYGKFDCIGTLKLTIKFPKETEQLLFGKTRWHFIERPAHWIFSVASYSKEDIGDGTEFDIIRPNISWGTFFRALAYDKDNNRLSSDTISINSFISPDHLDLILKHADIDDISNKSISLYIRDRTLNVDCDDDITINAFSANGILIFSGPIHGHMEIPVTPPVVFIQYKTNNQTITKKLIVK